MIACVELTNFCQHRHLAVEFTPGINAILGFNGSGKSNLLSALAGALTGDFGDDQGKCVAWGCGKEPAGVRLLLRRPSGDWQLERWLQAGPRQPRWLLTGPLGNPQEQVWTGEKAVRAQLQELLGCPGEVLRAHAFIDQWEVFSFLTASPSVRVGQLQEMLGLKRLERVWTYLGETAAQLTGLPAATAAVAVATARTVLEERTAQLGELEALLADLPSLETLQAEETRARLLLSAWEGKRHLEAQLGPATARTTALLEQEQQARAYLQTARAALQAARVDLEALALTPAELADWRRLAEEQQRPDRRPALQAALEQAQRELATSPDAPARAAALEDLLRTGTAQQRTLEQCLARREHLQGLNLLRDGQPCPVCRTLLEPAAAAQLRVTTATELADLEATIAELQAQRAAIEARYQELRARELALAALAQRAALLTQSLADLPPPPPPAPFTLAEVTELQMLYRNAGARVQANEAEVGVAEQLVLRTQDQLAEAQRQQEEVLQKWSALEVREDQVAGAEATLDRVRLQTAQRHGGEGRQEILRQGHAQAQRDLQTAEEALRAALQREALQRHVQALRAVFHRDGLPAALLRQNFHFLGQHANELLQLFETPFALHLEDDFSMQAAFASGKITEARRLSGAEKVVTAFALRAAIGLLPGSQIGFLCLDEAVVGLDRRYLARLPAVLDRLRVLAGRSGLQLILVTHEQALRPLFDHVILIGDYDHG